MSEPSIVTGLVTAAVNLQPAPAQVPAVIPPQVPQAEMPEGWTIHRVAHLVRDLAMNLYDVPIILKKHSLAQASYDKLTANEFFKRALEAATVEWNSPLSTHKRLAMEAAIALEDALPDVAARLRKATEPLPGVVALAQLFAKMAGIGENNAQHQTPTERFRIVINLGADTQQFNKQAPKLIDVTNEQIIPTAEKGILPSQQIGYSGKTENSESHME